MVKAGNPSTVINTLERKRIYIYHEQAAASERHWADN